MFRNVVKIHENLLRCKLSYSSIKINSKAIATESQILIYNSDANQISIAAKEGTYQQFL